METLQSELKEIKEKHSAEIEEYNDKKTQEGIITLTMIVFLVSSIISLLIGSIFARRMPDHTYSISEDSIFCFLLYSNNTVS